MSRFTIHKVDTTNVGPFYVDFYKYVGKWFIVNEHNRIEHLHRNGSVYISCLNPNGEYTGYFKTRKQAREVLKMYKEKQKAAKAEKAKQKNKGLTK